MEFTKVKFMVVWLDNNLGYTENNNNPKKNQKTSALWCWWIKSEYNTLYTIKQDKKKVITNHLQNISDNILCLSTGHNKY